MASEKQISANRQNAAMSAGPKSPAGKQVARMNALKHGLQAAQVVIPGEDPDEFKDLLQGLHEHYRPVGSLEHVLVERITYCTWRLQRANLIETTILRREHWELESSRAQVEMDKTGREMNWIASKFDDNLDDDQSDEDESREDHNLSPDEAEALWRDYEKAEKAYDRAKKAHDKAEEELESLYCAVDKAFWRSQHKLEKLLRYETTIERQLRNAMQDLEQLQSARTANAVEAASVIDVADLNRNES